MSAALPMAVDARNLTYRYGSFTAVDDVTLQVRPGETMGLLGPNGAGKTTVVRMLTTLTPVQHGELRILGLDTRDQTIDIRSNIGYVPQQLSIEPALTGSVARARHQDHARRLPSLTHLRDDALHLQLDDRVPVEAEHLGEDLVAVLVEVG